MEGFAVTCQLAPSTSHLISSSCSPPRQFALGFLQTPPRDDALALPLTFGSANTWYRDFHPTSLMPCPAHTPCSAAASAVGLEFLDTVPHATPLVLIGEWLFRSVFAIPTLCISATTLKPYIAICADKSIKRLIVNRRFLTLVACNRVFRNEALDFDCPVDEQEPFFISLFYELYVHTSLQLTLSTAATLEWRRRRPWKGRP